MKSQRQRCYHLPPPGLRRAARPRQSPRARRRPPRTPPGTRHRRPPSPPRRAQKTTRSPPPCRESPRRLTPPTRPVAEPPGPPIPATTTDGRRRSALSRIGRRANTQAWVIAPRVAARPYEPAGRRQFFISSPWKRCPGHSPARTMGRRHRPEPGTADGAAAGPPEPGRRPGPGPGRGRGRRGATTDHVPAFPSAAC